MQPNYANYPRPPVEEVSFSTIGEAWNVVTKNLGPFVVAALVGLVLLYVPVMIGSLIGQGVAMGAGAATDPSAAFGAAIMSQLIQTPFVILGYALAAPVFGSISYMALKWCRGEAIEMADLSFGFSRFAAFAVAGCLSYLAVTIGTYLCCIPGLIAGGCLMLTFPLIADRGLSPIDAMKASWAMLSKHMLMASLLYIVAAIVSSLGVIACGVGILVTFPIMFVVGALVYRDFTGVGPTMATPAGTPMAPTQPAPTEPAPPAEPPSGEGG